MGNMSDRDFENTANDLEACVARIEDDDLPVSETELRGLERILNEARVVVSHAGRIEDHFSEMDE